MWRAPSIVAALLAVLTASVVLTGCADAVVPVDSGVKGTVVLEGGPPELQGPLEGLRVAAHEGDETGPVAATATSDADGAFKLALAPGEYTVVALWKDGSSSVPVTVESGAYRSVTIVFRAK